MLVSGSYFPVLGLQPALGRLFTVDDDRNIGGHFVTVLSHDYWTTTLGSNPAVLNDTIIVNGQALTIVGVAPRGFSGTTLGSEPKVFVPLTMRALMSPGWKGFDEPTELLGVSVRATEAGRHNRAGARIVERSLPADHQRCRSAAAEGHERSDDGAASRPKSSRSSLATAGRARFIAKPKRRCSSC